MDILYDHNEKSLVNFIYTYYKKLHIVNKYMLHEIMGNITKLL